MARFWITATSPDDHILQAVNMRTRSAITVHPIRRTGCSQLRRPVRPRNTGYRFWATRTKPSPATTARPSAIDPGSGSGLSMSSAMTRTNIKFANAWPARARRSTRSATAIAARLIDTPTNRSPSSAALAPAAARKKSCQPNSAAAKA